MSTLYLTGIIILVLATADTIWAANSAVREVAFSVHEFLARASATPLLFLGSLVIFWQADRHRRSAAEQLRISRQLRTMPTFISSIDSQVMKDLMRATIAPRYFSRILDDNDVVREPQWPDPSQLLDALGVRNNLDENNEDDGSEEEEDDEEEDEPK